MEEEGVWKHNGNEDRWWRTKDNRRHGGTHTAGWRTTSDKEIGAEGTRFGTVGQIFIKEKIQEWQGDREL